MSLPKDEPVLVVSAAGAAVSYVGGLLVTHGVITSTEASATTQQVVPAVAAVLVLAIGALARRLVTPATKVRDLLEKDGMLSDADYGRLEGLLREVGVSVPPVPTLPIEPLLGTPPPGLTGPSVGSAP